MEIDEIKKELMEYGIDMEGLYKETFKVFTNMYEYYQSFRSHPDRKIRDMTKKAFSEVRRWGKEFFLIVAIDNIRVDVKRLKSCIKRHGNFAKRNKELIDNLKIMSYENNKY